MADNISLNDKYRQAGLSSLPDYVQEAIEGGYLNLQPTRVKPVMFAHSKSYAPKNTSMLTDQVIVANSELRNAVSEMFFRNSNGFRDMMNLTGAADRTARDVATKHYTYFGNTSNVGLALNNLNKYKSMAMSGKGNIIAMDTETFAFKGMENFPGITELAYHVRSANTIKNSRELKPLFDGALDGRGASKSFLFGLTSAEQNTIMSKINHFKTTGTISHDDTIMMQRLGMYAKSDIGWDNNLGRFVLNKLGDGPGEFSKPNDIISLAEQGLGILSGKTQGFERMADQTIQSSKAHDFIVNMLLETNHEDNLVAIFNQQFDAPLLNNLLRNATPHMSNVHKAQIAALGGGINTSNIFDPMEIFNAAYGNNVSKLYGDVLKAYPDELSKSMRLETLIDVVYKKHGYTAPGGAHHQASQDVLDTLNLLSYRDESGNLIFNHMADSIKENLKNATGNGGILNPDGHNLQKGDIMYFMNSVERGQMDTFQYNNWSLGQAIEDTHKTGNKYIVGSKEVMKFDGIYKGNMTELSKSLTAQQQKSLQQAISSGAMKDDFYVGVLKNAYNQSVMLYGRDEWDISRRLQGGMVVGRAAGQSQFFNQDSIAIDQTAMSALGASEGDLRLRTQGLIGDIDKAQKRYRGWFDVAEGDRSINQAKKFFSEAKRLSDAGITKDEFFKIAFDGQTVRGISAKEVFQNLAQYQYGEEVKYTSSALRDMYHMYDRLSAEAEVFLPVINKIESQFGSLEGTENKMKAKQVMSSIHDDYQALLERSGVSSTMSVNKLGYEKNAVVIPRNLFSSSEYGSALNMIKNGEAIEDLGIELNVTNINGSASRINNLIKQAAETEGASFNEEYASASVDKLIRYFADNDLMTPDQANKILSTKTYSAYAKAQSAMETVSSNHKYHETIRPEFDITDFSAEKAAEISRAISQNKETLINSVDDMIVQARDGFHIANMRAQDVTSEFKDKIMSSDFIQDLIKSAPQGELASELFDVNAIANSTAEELAKSMSIIRNKVNSEGKDFAFSILKEEGDKLNKYYLAMGLSQDIADGKVLNKMKSNVALVELPSQTFFQGIPTIHQSGYRQVAGRHLDGYEVLKTGDIKNFKIYDSLSYSMKQIGIMNNTISEAIVAGDYQRAASRTNKAVQNVIGKLTRSSFDVYDNEATARVNDLLYSGKVYMDDAMHVFGDKAFDVLKDADPKHVDFATVNQLFNNRLKGYGDKFSAAKKIADNKAELDSTNITQAMKIMLGNASGQKVDPIAQEVAKFAKAAGVPEDHVASIFFSVHEGDANNRLSGWGFHPSYFHDYGFMYSNKRPVGRQNLTGRTYMVDKAKAVLGELNDHSITAGSPINTRLSNLYKDMLNRGSTQGAIENSLTGNVLLMSQQSFDNAMKAIRDSIVNNPNASQAAKAEAETMYRRMNRLNITNQESIISYEVGNILGDKDVAIYNTKRDNFNFTKEMTDSLSGVNEVNVTKGQLIGSAFDSQGTVQEIRAKATGRLVKGEDGRYVLRASDMTNQTMKIGMNGTEKSVGTIIGKEETRWLRQHLGDFAAIGNYEIFKHEGFNTLYHDLFAKRFQELQSKGASESDFNALRGDMAYALSGKRDLVDQYTKLTKDGAGKISGVEVLSYDSENILNSFKGNPEGYKEAAERISQNRNKWLHEVQKGYAKTNPSMYDIKKTINAGGYSFDAYNLKGTLLGMSIVDDIVEDKGIKFDIRLAETLLRPRDADGNQIAQGFVESVYKLENGKFSSLLAMDGEMKRLNDAKYDVDNMSKFLNMYTLNKSADEVGVGTVKEMKSVLEMPFYKTTMGSGIHVNYEELQEHMKKGNKMFGNEHDFAKIKLHREVDINGKKLTELYLPNVNMAGIGENVFAATEYQKSMKDMINKTIDLKKASMPGQKLKHSYEQYERDYVDSVKNVVNAIKSDYGSKEGRLGDMFHVRLKNSGITENKELFREIGNFTAGKDAAEDILYVSQEYAQRLLGSEFGSVKDKLMRSEVMNKYGKEALEENWGIMGLGTRWPTILENSSKAVKIRVADGLDGEKTLGGRQSLIFRHTSYGFNADNDGDQLGVVALHKLQKGTKEYDSLMARYNHQFEQNKIAKSMIEDEYVKVFGPHKGGTKIFNFNELMDHYKTLKLEDKLPFTSRLDAENIKGIQGAFAAKVGVGKANIPSFYLRQHAVESFNQGKINHKQLQLVSAFTETAEQKMIDAIKKDNINAGDKPIDRYFRALHDNDSDGLVDLAKSLKGEFGEDMLKRYAYHTADGALYQKIKSGDKKAMDNAYGEMVKTLRTVMKDSGYKPEGMRLAISGNMSEELLRQTLNNSVVMVKDSASDIFAKNVGITTLHKAVNSHTNSVLGGLKNSQKRDIIEEDIQSISANFKKAMNKAGEAGTDFAARAMNFFKTSGGKKVGLALAALPIASMALGAMTQPASKTRDRDDVGLMADGEGGHMPLAMPAFTRTAPVVSGGQRLNGGGLQININASNKGGLSDDDIQGLLRNAFGGDINVRMNMSDDRGQINANDIESMMMSSLGY